MAEHRTYLIKVAPSIKSLNKAEPQIKGSDVGRCYYDPVMNNLYTVLAFSDSRHVSVLALFSLTTGRKHSGNIIRAGWIPVNVEMNVTSIVED